MIAYQLFEVIKLIIRFNKSVMFSLSRAQLTSCIRSKTMETSNLSKIENLPENPFDLFKSVIDEVKKCQSYPLLAMTIASVNE